MSGWIIHKKVEKSSRAFPDSMAIDDGARNITYRELNLCANRVAHALSEFGVVKGSVVGIYLDASIEYIVALLGVLKAGAIFMPLNRRFPDRRIKSIIGKIGPFSFITNNALESVFLAKWRKFELSADSKCAIIIDDQLNFDIKSLPEGNSVADFTKFQSNDLSLPISPDDGCYIMTTSGSTGEPKAILGCHKGVSHFMDWEINEFEFDKTNRTSLLSHITFDASLRDIFIPLCTGGTLFIPDGDTTKNAKRLIQWLKHNEINIVHTVPTMFRLLTEGLKLAQRENIAVDSIKNIMLAGEPLYWEDVKKWNDLYAGKCEIANFYGPSETTLIKVFHRIQEVNQEATDLVPLGRPLPETEILVLKDKIRCEPGDTGEIYIKTDFMTKGYYNDQALTKQYFIQNPIAESENDIIYKTGDLGYVSEHGILYFSGRKDEQIKLSGIRVELGEIEVELRKHPEVINAAVIAEQNEDKNNELICFVQADNKSEFTTKNIKKYLSENLPDYMVPGTFIFLNEIPLLPNGKVHRRKLLESNKKDSKTDYFKPDKILNIEHGLSMIWQELLGISDFDRNANFFDLGGTSVKVMQMVNMIDQILHIEIPAVKVFEHPTIQLLSNYLKDSDQNNIKGISISERAKHRRKAYSKRKLKAV